MFQELVAQAKRLFSSKRNGGRLVYKLTDRLHNYKQVLLATSIVLLVGYHQFREHFVCQGLDHVDKIDLTNFCWNNGTKTIDINPNYHELPDDAPATRDNIIDSDNNARASNVRVTRALVRGARLIHHKGNNNNSIGASRNNDEEITTATTGISGRMHARAGSGNISKSVVSMARAPHPGLNFQPSGKYAGEYEPINHNYMRSLWALLILMAICSFIAQRRWAALFEHDTLRALLKLPGHNDLSTVRRAQETHPYETLIKLPSLDDDNANKHCTLTMLFEGSQLLKTVEILIGEENEHNHLLDYYPNQLIYLLMAKRTRAYKLAKLNIKKKLVLYSVHSFVLTLMQFLLPLMFIGNKYALYGWHFFKAWLKYTLDQLAELSFSNDSLHRRIAPLVNSIDYELSARIWPISVQCEYHQFGLHGMDSATVQCTASINEISGKIFFVIWWFVAINIVVEFCSLCFILICSVNFDWAERIFGYRFWPKARDEARIIASFRFKHCLALNEQLTRLMIGLDNRSESAQKTNAAQGKAAEAAAANKTPLDEVFKLRGLSERRRKAFEALESRMKCRSRSSSFASGVSDRDTDVHAYKTLRDGDGFRETSEDSNIYYLLYLLHLRLGKSRQKTEQVLRMTSAALSRYLESLSKLESLKKTNGVCTLAGERNEHGYCASSICSSDASDRATVIAAL